VLKVCTIRQQNLVGASRALNGDTAEQTVEHQLDHARSGGFTIDEVVSVRAFGTLPLRLEPLPFPSRARHVGLSSETHREKHTWRTGSLGPQPDKLSEGDQSHLHRFACGHYRDKFA
jgi:hypothetical protein